MQWVARFITVFSQFSSPLRRGYFSFEILNPTQIAVGRTNERAHRSKGAVRGSRSKIGYHSKGRQPDVVEKRNANEVEPVAMRNEDREALQVRSNQKRIIQRKTRNPRGSCFSCYTVQRRGERLSSSKLVDGIGDERGRDNLREIKSKNCLLYQQERITQTHSFSQTPSLREVLKIPRLLLNGHSIWSSGMTSDFLSS